MFFLFVEFIPYVLCTRKSDDLEENCPVQNCIKKNTGILEPSRNYFIWHSI